MNLIFSLLGKYKRLFWFLGVPSGFYGLLALLRFFFVSKNFSLPPPGVLNPNNPIQFHGKQKFSLQEYENELDSVKRQVDHPQSKLISLRFPNRDSLNERDLSSLVQKQEPKAQDRNILTDIPGQGTNKIRQVSHPEFYDPSLEEVRKYQDLGDNPSRLNKRLEFNSYSRPERISNPNDKVIENGTALRTRVVDDQTFTEGSEIQVRLIEQTELGEVKLPKNTLFKAFIEYDGDRVLFIINSIKIGGRELNGNWVSQAPDRKWGISMKDLTGNSLKNSNYLSESKNHLLQNLGQDMGQQIGNTIPLASSLINPAMKRNSIQEKKQEFSIKDEYEILFQSK